jgi:L-aminopeptidase/D-esterase-like protein
MLPVVAETCDWYLNDINGLHVLEEHALAAIDGAKSGPVAEGNVGGGTGMTTYEFKGGNGTSSRVVGIGGQNFTVGALVQANFGRRPDLTILGVPVGRIVAEHAFRSETRGSIIAVVGTDAPLLPSQLTRLAKRISLGVGRTGTPSNNGSGDIFLAFSTANRPSAAESGLRDSADHIPHDQLDPLFLATVEATEEAVVNAMVAAETMVGRDGHTVHALDHGRLLDAMRRFNRAIGA